MERDGGQIGTRHPLAEFACLPGRDPGVYCQRDHTHAVRVYASFLTPLTAIQSGQHVYQHAHTEHFVARRTKKVFSKGH